MIKYCPDLWNEKGEGEISESSFFSINDNQTWMFALKACYYFEVISEMGEVQGFLCCPGNILGMK